MSDDNKPQDEAPIEENPKKLRGFANPENRKNINRAGRRKGAVGKVPSDKDIEDSILKANPRAVQKLLSLLDEGTENNQLKAAFKIGDWSMQILKERNAVRVAKKNTKTGEKEEYTQEKATGTDGAKVLQLISTEYKEEDKESEEEEKE